MVVRTSHIVVAVILHVVVLGMLFVGFRCSKKVTPPPVIQATIVGTPAPAKPEPPKEDPRKIEEEKRKAELEKQKIEEQKKAEQEAKLKAKEDAKKKAAEDLKKKKEDAERKTKEQEAEKKKQQQKELESQLNQQLKQEESQRNSAARATAQQVWVAQIIEKVKRNWLQPPGAPDDFKCEVHVQLLPAGQVVGVTLAGTSGNSLVDESVRRAVLKSDPLPVPQDPSVFERELNFTFTP